MNSNLSLDSYVSSYLARALSSIVVMITASFGISIVDNNATGNNYKYSQANITFHNWFFGLTLAVEGVSAITFITLWFLQRGKYDITNINRIDCRSSCFFIMFRLAWTISLSIFILDSINQLERGNLSRPWYNHKDIYRDREMNAIRLIVRLIVGFECVQIIGFIWGVLYQPTDYVREVEFDRLD